MSKLIARIASAAAIALAAIPVVAATAAHADTRRITVSDLDFSRAAHVAVFEKRIARAAFEICPADTRQNSAKAEACRQTLRSQAVAALGDSQRIKLARVESEGFALAAK
jgi:UrcA family protein